MRAHFVLALAVVLCVATAGGASTDTASTTTSAVEGSYLLAFAGDVHFENQVRRQVASGGLSTLPALFAGADLVVVNLETALTKRGTAQPKQYTFRADPAVLSTLAEAGVDAVTMANNHAMDFGSVGLSDTLAAKRRSPVSIAGIGTDSSEAVAPVRFTLGPKPGGAPPLVVSLVAFSVLDPYSNGTWAAGSSRAGIAVWSSHKRLILDRVRAEASAGHLVVAYPHWGVERAACPSTSQRSVLAELEAAGADLVIGSHPHVLQGVGFTKFGTAVAYSLGNFVWYAHAPGKSMVLRVRVDNGRVTALEPTAVLWGSDGLPRAASAKQTDVILDQIRTRTACAGLRSTRPA